MIRNYDIEKVLNSTGIHHSICKKYVTPFFQKKTGELYSYQLQVYKSISKKRQVRVSTISSRGMPSYHTRTETYTESVFDHYEKQTTTYDSLRLCFISFKDTVFNISSLERIYISTMNMVERKNVFSSSQYLSSYETWIFAVPHAYLTDADK